MSENISMVFSTFQSRDKLRTNAVTACERLGKYRMPFAWTAINVMNIIHGTNSLDRDSGSEKESTGSYSLGMFFSYLSVKVIFQPVVFVCSMKENI